MKQTYLKSFVQRNRTLSEAQKALITRSQNVLISSSQILNQVPSNKKINLEIGFGKGVFLIRNSMQYRDEIFVGADPYITGTINILKKIEEHNLDNILLFQHDVRLLLEPITKPIFDKLFILFPDPWPKTKHHKRRIVNQYLLDEIKRISKTSSKTYIVTDDDDYALEIDELLAHNQNHFIKESVEDEIIDNIETYYHARALAKNHSIHKFILKKL